MGTSSKQELLDVMATPKESKEVVTVADLASLSTLIDGKAIE